MKKALICGVSGQDGSYLAQRLLSCGYQVWGALRDAQVASSFPQLIERLVLGVLARESKAI